MTAGKNPPSLSSESLDHPHRVIEILNVRNPIAMLTDEPHSG